MSEGEEQNKNKTPEERREAIAAVIAQCQGPELGHEKVLQQKAYPDLFFQLGKDQVSAHTCIVKKRCEALLSGQEVVKRQRKKKNVTTVELKDGFITVETLNQVLHFIYTSSIGLKDMSQKEVLLLNKAAGELKLARLQWLCEHYLQEDLTMESVYPLLKDSNELKEKNVKAFCLQYAINAYNEFISNKDGVRLLGIDLFQEVVSAGATPGAAHFLEDKPAPPNTIVEDFKAIYNEMLNHDAFVKWPSSSPIQFHRAILGAHSAVFSSVFQNVAGPDMSAFPKAGGDEKGIDLTNISSTAFSSMLKYVYYKDKSIEPLPACELVPFARKYALKDLETLCEEIIKRSVAVDTVLPIIGVTYLPQMHGRSDITQELRPTAIQFVVDHLVEVKLQSLSEMDPRISVDILLACQANARGDPMYIPPDDAPSAAPAPLTGRSSSSSITTPAAAAPTPAAPAATPAPAATKQNGKTDPKATASPVKGGKSKADLKKEEKERKLREKKEAAARKKAEKEAKKAAGKKKGAAPAEKTPTKATPKK